MDLDATPYLPQIGAGALLTMAVWMLLTGRLATRRELQELRQDRDQWRATAQTLAPVVTELSGHVGRLADATQQLIARPAPWYPAATGRHAGPDDGPDWPGGGGGPRQTQPPAPRSGPPSRRG